MLPFAVYASLIFYELRLARKLETVSFLFQPSDDEIYSACSRNDIRRQHPNPKLRADHVRHFLSVKFWIQSSIDFEKRQFFDRLPENILIET